MAETDGGVSGGGSGDADGSGGGSGSRSGGRSGGRPGGRSGKGRVAPPPRPSDQLDTAARQDELEAADPIVKADSKLIPDPPLPAFDTGSNLRQYIGHFVMIPKSIHKNIQMADDAIGWIAKIKTVSTSGSRGPKVTLFTKGESSGVTYTIEKLKSMVRLI